MIDFIRELCDSDEEFLTIGILMNKSVENYKNRLLYVPINLHTPNKSTVFFLHLREEISKFDPHTAEKKIQQIVDVFGGCRIYVPMVDTFTRRIRDDKIFSLRKNGTTYSELSKMYNLSQTALRNVVEIKKNSSY